MRKIRIAIYILQLVLVIWGIVGPMKEELKKEYRSKRVKNLRKKLA